MANSCKYYKRQRQVSYDNGVTWINLQEYMKGALVESQSSECITPSIKIYRWEKSSSDDYVCVGSDKHYKEYYQESSDNGQSWTNVVPITVRTSGQVIEYNSDDCYYKFKAIYSDSSTYKVGCDDDSTLTSSDTHPDGYEYSAMTSAEIGSCVRSMARQSFKYCSSLSAITIPDTVTEIGGEAFSNCTSLTSVELPNGLTSIEYFLFYRCKSLTSVTIPDTVTAIGNDVFDSCSGLTSINIPSAVTTLGRYTFYGCSGLTSMELPSGLTSFGDSVFMDCSGLISVNIPTSITNIPDHAFSQCSSLTTIEIPSGVTNIGGYAFMECSGLTSITCNAVTPPTLGEWVFVRTNDCPIYVPSGSVNAYKTASGWSSYASRIQAII